MNEETAIVQSGMMPVLSIQDAVRRYNAIVEFTRTVMKPDKDYGIIPGTGTKPTLLKPGAEKLCSLFGLVPDPIVIDKILDFDKGLFYFQYRCNLYRDGKLVGAGVGSCNSREKKYRYRNVADNKATAEEKAAAIRTETKSGKYGAYKVYVIENQEPFELINTIDKMAQKRALVAATLVACNASEFFTQDVEDMGFIEGEYAEIHEQPAPPEPPKNSKKPAQSPPPEPPTEPEPVPAAMSLELAMSETGSSGEKYGDLDSQELSNRSIGIGKALAKNNISPEKREELLRKQAAIGVILAHRNLDATQ